VAEEAAREDASCITMKNLALATSLLLAAGACGRSALDGVNPKTLVPAAGGAVGHSDAGDTGGASECPPCIAKAMTACIPAGDCMGSGHGAPHGNAWTYCYDNGVTVSHSASVNGNRVITTESVSKNGQPCYAKTFDDGGSGPVTVTVKDGNGNLTEGIRDLNGTFVDCGGISYELKDTCGIMADTSQCSSGECS